MGSLGEEGESGSGGGGGELGKGGGGLVREGMDVRWDEEEGEGGSEDGRVGRRWSRRQSFGSGVSLFAWWGLWGQVGAGKVGVGGSIKTGLFVE